MWNYYIQENSGAAHIDKKKTEIQLRLFGDTQRKTLEALVEHIAFVKRGKGDQAYRKKLLKKPE